MKVRVLAAPGIRFPGESIVVEEMGIGPSFPPSPEKPRCVVIDVGDKLGLEAAYSDPDIVVFTHDDSDHIGDADKFFEQLARAKPRDREFWLPADWLLLELAYAAEAGLPPLSANASAAGPDLTPEVVRSAIVDGTDLYAEYFSFKEDNDPPLRRKSDPEGGRTKELSNNEVVARIRDAITAGRVDVALPKGAHPSFSGSPLEVAKRVVKQAGYIRSIIRNAMRSGTVRWFAVQSALRGSSSSPIFWSSEGRPGYFTLVNAREIHPFCPLTITGPGVLFYLAQLTVQNRRALVTYAWAPPRMKNDGVIVWSDSDGVSCDVTGSSRRTPWWRTALMTAPHHGSRALAHRPIWNAYKAARRSIGVLLSNNAELTWDDYYRVPASWRGCTFCACSYKGRSEELVAVLAPWGWVIEPDCESTSRCPVPWGSLSGFSGVPRRRP